MAIQTPMLYKMRSYGSTMYVFPSAAEAINLNLSQTTTSMALSHYVLIDTGKFNWKKLLGQTKQNDNYDDDSKQIENFAGDYSISINEPADIYQYVMSANIQNLLFNNDTYQLNKQDKTTYQTCSEQLFWNWLAYMTDYQFTAKTTNDTEDNTANSFLSKTVKSIGTISAGSSNRNSFGIYNDVYITVPTSAGSVNCSARTDMADYNKYLDPLLSLQRTGNYNTYMGRLTQTYNDIPITSGDTDTYRLSDENQRNIYIDFNNISDTDNNKYNSWDEYSSSDKAGQTYEFNCILLYYSVYDINGNIKTPYATNLFGFILLNGPKGISENSNGVSNSDQTSNISLDEHFVIPGLTKIKSTTSNYGNSYSFKVNMHSSSTLDMTHNVIQDNPTESVIAEDLAAAISKINDACDTLYRNTDVINHIMTKYNEIISYYDNLSTRIKSLEEQISWLLNGKTAERINANKLFVNEYISNDNSKLTLTSNGALELTLNKNSVQLYADEFMSGLKQSIEDSNTGHPAVIQYDSIVDSDENLANVKRFNMISWIEQVTKQLNKVINSMLAKNSEN